MATAIEDLVAKADSGEHRGCGYHVHASFADGSVINAPILQSGPDWARFAEIVEDDDGLYVDLAGASLQVDWAPGPGYATGPRFDNLLNRVLSSSAAP